MAHRFPEVLSSEVPDRRPNKPVSLSVPEALLCRHVLLLQCVDLLFFSGIVRNHGLVESI